MEHGGLGSTGMFYRITRDKEKNKDTKEKPPEKKKKRKDDKKA